MPRHIFFFITPCALFCAQDANIRLLLNPRLSLCWASDVSLEHYWIDQLYNGCQWKAELDPWQVVLSDLYSVATLILTVICLCMKTSLPKNNCSNYQSPACVAEKDPNLPSDTNIGWTLLCIQEAAPLLFISPSPLSHPRPLVPTALYILGSPSFFLAVIVN